MVQSTSQTTQTKAKYEQIFLRRQPCQLISGKNAKSKNKIAMKNFAKICHTKSTFDCTSMSRYSCVKLTHIQQKWYLKQGCHNPD